MRKSDITPCGPSSQPSSWTADPALQPPKGAFWFISPRLQPGAPIKSDYLSSPVLADRHWASGRQFARGPKPEARGPRPSSLSAEICIAAHRLLVEIRELYALLRLHLP